MVFMCFWIFFLKKNFDFYDINKYFLDIWMKWVIDILLEVDDVKFFIIVLN